MKKILVTSFVIFALLGLMTNIYANNSCTTVDVNGVLIEGCRSCIDVNGNPCVDNNQTDTDDNETDTDDNETDTDDNETDINKEIGKFGSTQFAMKIKLIHLINTIDLKIAQAQSVVDAINDMNDSNVTIDTVPIATEITNLQDIKTRIQTTLDDKNLIKEQILEVFLTEKENAKTAIKNIREYIRENCPIEMRNEFKIKFREQKKELKPEFHQRVKELRSQHNEFVKGEFREILGQTKKQLKIGPPKTKNIDSEELETEFQEKIREKKEQREINQKLMQNRVKVRGGNN